MWGLHCEGMVEICLLCEYTLVSIYNSIYLFSFKGMFGGSEYAILQSRPLVLVNKQIVRIYWTSSRSWRLDNIFWILFMYGPTHSKCGGYIPLVVTNQLVPFLNLCVFMSYLLSVPLDDNAGVIDTLLSILFQYFGFQC
jgi:hypothetical protein